MAEGRDGSHRPGAHIIVFFLTSGEFTLRAFKGTQEFHGFTQRILHSKGESYLVLMKSQTRICAPTLLEAYSVSTGLLPPPVLPVSHQQQQCSLRPTEGKTSDGYNKMLANTAIHSSNLNSSQEPGLAHPLNSLSSPALSLKPYAHILRKLA